MDVKNNNLNQIIEMIRETLGPLIKGTVEQLIVKVKDEYLPQLKKFVGDILKSRNVKYESVDVLTKRDMVSFIRLNRVDGSDGVAAFKQPKDEKVFVYLAYCKEKDLLSEETNCYIVIEAKALDEAVEELFKESDLIILN